MEASVPLAMIFPTQCLCVDVMDVIMDPHSFSLWVDDPTQPDGIRVLVPKLQPSVSERQLAKNFISQVGPYHSLVANL